MLYLYFLSNVILHMTCFIEGALSEKKQTVVIHFDGLENSLLCMYKAPICKLLLINKPQITF